MNDEFHRGPRSTLFNYNPERTFEQYEGRDTLFCHFSWDLCDPSVCIGMMNPKDLTIISVFVYKHVAEPGDVFNLPISNSISQ